MRRFILPWMLLLTWDALLNLRRGIAGGERELAPCRDDLLYLPSENSSIKPSNFSLWYGWFALLHYKVAWQFFTFHVANQGESQEHAVIGFGRYTCSSTGFASVTACWKQRSQGAVQWADPGSFDVQKASFPAHLKSLAQLWAVALYTWVMPQAKPSLTTVD